MIAYISNPTTLLANTSIVWSMPFMFFLLMLAHFMAEYPLQGDFLTKAKNRWHPIKGVPWWQAMTAHCSIHAGFVMIITNSVALGILEFIIHFCIDSAKCDGKLSFNEDQILHVITKVFILFLWIAFVL